MGGSIYGEPSLILIFFYKTFDHECDNHHFTKYGESDNFNCPCGNKIRTKEVINGCEDCDLAICKECFQKHVTFYCIIKNKENCRQF